MSKIRSVIFGIFVVLVALLLFVPLPAIVLEIFVGIEFAASVGLLLYALKSKSSKPISSPILMPRAVLGFSLFSLAVNMGLVRAMLTGLINTYGVQIPLVSFLAETVCRGNCVIGIVAIAILWGLEVFLGSRLLFRVCEIKSNDFTSSMSGAARFVLGNATAIKVLSIISLVAGFGIEIVKSGKVSFKTADSIVSFAMEIPLNEKTLQNTADSVIPLVTGNAFFFVIPLLVVSFAMWLCVTKEPVAILFPQEPRDAEP